MALEPIKLSYIAAQLRVRCEFTKAHSMLAPEPPADLIERARKKLKAAEQDGQLVFYRIYETRLKTMWKKMRESQEDPNTPVAVTLASGTPALSGLTVKRSTDERYVAKITIDAGPEEIAKWQHFFLKLTISKQLSDLGIKRIPNPAQIKRIWLHAAAGLPVKEMPLMPLPAIPSAEKIAKLPFEMVEDPSHGDLSVVIYDVCTLEANGNWQMLQTRLSHSKTMKKKNAPGNYVILYDDVVRTLRSAFRGPERYGIDLPVVLLVGVDEEILQKSKLSVGNLSDNVGKPKVLVPKSAAKTNKDATAILDKLRATVLIAQDQMAVTVDVLPEDKLIPLPEADVRKWLLKELATAGVVFGIDAQAVDTILKGVYKNNNYLEVKVAQGQVAQDGAEPYLHMVYKDAKPTAAEDQDITVDVRELQQRTVVRKGQLVAEIRYKQPAKDGHTVTGEVLTAVRPPHEPITLGEGLEVRGADKYYATMDGVPVVEANNFKLEKVLVHEGDVNFSFGNIHFEGNVEIKGKIDRGVIVEVGGSLTVHKTIGGAIVRVHNDLVVTEGINTGTEGSVACGGNLKADFIENSTVRCKGEMTVNRSIIGSKVYVQKILKVGTSETNGVVTGGVTSAVGGAQCVNVGRDNGPVTELYIGGDIRHEIVHHNLQKRLEKVEKMRDDFKRKLKHLNAKTAAQLTKKDLGHKAKVEKGVSRFPTLIDHLHKRMVDVKEKITFNQEARLAIINMLSTNCKITIAGKPYKNLTPIIGVGISYKTGRGVKAEPLAGKPGEGGAGGKGAKAPAPAKAEATEEKPAGKPAAEQKPAASDQKASAEQAAPAEQPPAADKQETPTAPAAETKKAS